MGNRGFSGCCCECCDDYGHDGDLSGYLIQPDVSPTTHRHQANGTPPSRRRRRLDEIGQDGSAWVSRPMAMPGANHQSSSSSSSSSYSQVMGGQEFKFDNATPSSAKSAEFVLAMPPSIEDERKFMRRSFSLIQERQEKAPKECLLCMDTFSAEFPDVRTLCECGVNKNSYHLACLLEWRQRSGKTTCPVCEHELYFEDQATPRL